MTDINELEALARKATPGPWMLAYGDGGGWGAINPTPEDAANVFQDEDVSRQDAEYIAAANPATVLALIRRLRTAENVVKDYDTNFPCDGGCNVNDGPEETCSRHGRAPSDLWNLLDQERKELRRAQETVNAIEDFVVAHYLDTQMGRRVLALIDPIIYDEGKTDDH